MAAAEEVPAAEQRGDLAVVEAHPVEDGADVRGELLPALDAAELVDVVAPVAPRLARLECRLGVTPRAHAHTHTRLFVYTGCPPAGCRGGSHLGQARGGGRTNRAPALAPGQLGGIATQPASAPGSRPGAIAAAACCASTRPPTNSIRGPSMCSIATYAASTSKGVGWGRRTNSRENGMTRRASRSAVVAATVVGTITHAACAASTHPNELSSSPRRRVTARYMKGNGRSGRSPRGPSTSTTGAWPCMPRGARARPRARRSRRPAPRARTACAYHRTPPHR